MVGMNSVIMDGALIADECIVGAMAFVKAESVFKARQLIVGSPAKAIKEISEEMIAWKTAGTKLYQQLPADCHETLREVAPLREIPKNRPVQEDFYKTLAALKNK
jgi:phenylacetic acid degradation protein